MSERPPIESIVGEDLPADERASLDRVHGLLLAVGPPPELPPSLAEPPMVTEGRVIPLPRRYRFTAIAAAAAFAITVFGAGYLIGGGDGPNEPERTVVMTGDSGAVARLAVFAKDGAGNWPMELEVEGLPSLPTGTTYELWLTKDGELAEVCGTFVVAGRETQVPLNAPYPLRAFTGWVVVRAGSTDFVLRTETV
jgi:anti-sigma-K factor RskA